MKRLLLAFLLIITGVANAQTPGDNLRIYLLTFGPGDAVFEKFGHNAIVVDEGNGASVAYNWGMFDFDQPGFVPRLMKGRMLYWMAGYDTNAFINAYIQDNRTIWLQELNLTPAQRAEVKQFVEWNAREENKFYRYDYYRDNCSTRVRDVIDRATGGALKLALNGIPSGTTYRSHTQALTYTSPFTYAGLQLAMGHNIDRPLSAWEESFIPMQLMEWVRKVNVTGENGTQQPLVLREQVVFEAMGREPIAEKAPSMIVPFAVVGVLIAALLIAFYRLGARRRGALVTLAVLIGVLSFAFGFFGTLIELLWAFTDHVVTYRNENVLQANPLSFFIMVLGPIALIGKPWARRYAAWFALFVAGLSALGFIIQALPNLDQVNGDVIGLLMPIHSAIAYILWRNWKGRGL